MRSHSAFTMISLLVKGKPMHSIVLLTALSATTGLFGGGHGKAKHCGRPSAGGHCVSAPVAHNQPQPGCGTAPMAHNAPPVQMAPAPQMMAPNAHAMAAPQTAYNGYQSNYAAPAASSCAGGSCARR